MTEIFFARPQYNCVRASPKEIDRLMNGNLWPRDVIVKEFTKLI